MKLKRKLIVAFLISVLLPILLGVLAVSLAYKTNLIHSFIPRLQQAEAREYLQNLMFLVVTILVLTAIVLAWWIYTSMITPIEKLTIATRHIRDGELDFALDVDTGNDEVGELCRDFENMRKRLKYNAEEKIRLDKENRELITNISHDLKTPITTVKGYVEGIIDGVADTPEKMDHYIRTIYSKANEMDRLIDELTFYTKIDTNRIPYSFATLSVRDYFDDCVEELQMELDAQQIGLSYDNQVPPQTRMIADPEQLRRVINNIVGNSVKYMDREKPEKKIGIRLLDVGDYVQIEISDNGIGIPAADVPHVFDRFFRSDTSRHSGAGGSGIGLSIVQKIIEDHGGQIWASSKEGEGTTMHFVLHKASI